MLYGIHRMSSRQHSRITWESTRMNPELRIKFDVEARKCQGQGLNKVAGRLTWGGAPCSVWPKKKQDTVARAGAIGAREIIMVTDIETGRTTVRQRGADPMAGRSAMRQGLSKEERAVRSRRLDQSQLFRFSIL